MRLSLYTTYFCKTTTVQVPILGSASENLILAWQNLVWFCFHSQHIYGITLQLPTSDQVKVMLERDVFKKMTNTLLQHKADIFQAERLLVISD